MHLVLIKVYKGVSSIEGIYISPPSQYHFSGLHLASYPGSRIKGVGGKESLVHTVCACSRFSQKSGKLYSSTFFNSAEFIECYISLCLLCNQFLRMKLTYLTLKEEQKQSIQKLLKIYKC